MKGYTIQAVDSLDGLMELRDEWKDLLSESAVNRVFLTWEWMSAWAEHYLGGERSPLVLVLRKKTVLQGIAPWYVNAVRYGPFRLRRVEFLGSPGVGSDSLDVIARSGKERETACRFYQYLMEGIAGKWDCLLLRGIPSDSIFCNNFINEFHRNGKYIRVTCGSYCPIVRLPATQDQFLSSLRPHRKRQYNRHLRMIREDGDVKYDIAGDLHSEERLRDFLSFYERTWGKTNDLHHRFLGTFLSREGANQWMEVEFLRRKEEYVAAVLHILYNGTKYSYLTAIDKGFNRRISVGNVLICLAIQDAIDRNMENYNFLKGGEPYKYHWANAGEQLLDIYFQKRKAVSAVQFASDSMKNVGKILLR